VSQRLWQPADGKVGRLDVTVEEANVVDGLDALQDLVAESERCREGERAAGLCPPQLRQVLSLQLHDDVVEPVVPAAADEPANVFSALELL